MAVVQEGEGDVAAERAVSRQATEKVAVERQSGIWQW